MRLSGNRVSKESTARSLSAPAPQRKRKKEGMHHVCRPECDRINKNTSTLGLDTGARTHQNAISNHILLKPAIKHRTVDLSENDHSKEDRIEKKRGQRKKDERVVGNKKGWYNTRREF